MLIAWLKENLFSIGLYKDVYPWINSTWRVIYGTMLFGKIKRMPNLISRRMTDGMIEICDIFCWLRTIYIIFFTCVSIFLVVYPQGQEFMLNVKEFIWQKVKFYSNVKKHFDFYSNVKNIAIFKEQFTLICVGEHMLLYWFILWSL